MSDHLRSTDPSDEVRTEVEELAKANVVYEHGQWWVLLDAGAQTYTFSVVDTDHGLDLEQC